MLFPLFYLCDLSLTTAPRNINIRLFGDTSPVNHCLRDIFSFISSGFPCVASVGDTSDRSAYHWPRHNTRGEVMRRLRAREWVPHAKIFPGRFSPRARGPIVYYIPDALFAEKVRRHESGRCQRPLLPPYLSSAKAGRCILSARVSTLLVSFSLSSVPPRIRKMKPSSEYFVANKR